MKSNVIISESNRPFWHLIIASLHYTAIFSLLFYFFIDLEFSWKLESFKRSIHILEIVLWILPSAIGFSVLRDVIFDLEERKYKLQYSVGPLRFGKWKVLPNIEYVSVFKQPLVDGSYIFETNLWYQRNGHFKIYESESLFSVMEMGKSVAKSLQVDLLDATKPNNYTWIKVDGQ